MIQPGKFNFLRVYSIGDLGVYLTDESNSPVLLPAELAPDGLAIDSEIDVFVYKDSSGRMKATIETPKIVLNAFAFLQVKSKTSFGVFMDWGLEKDLLIPYSQQAKEMHEENFYVVYLYYDEKSERLAGSTKVRNFLTADCSRLTINQKVNLLAYDRSEHGIHVIINNLYQGLLFTNEVFQTINIGDSLIGYVKKVREDGKVDVSLQLPGYSSVEPISQKIIDYLELNKGFLNLTDKSEPDEISFLLNMSKKTFKKAIGLLYKQRIVKIENDGIYLIQGNKDSKK